VHSPVNVAWVICIQLATRRLPHNTPIVEKKHSAASSPRGYASNKQRDCRTYPHGNVSRRCHCWIITTTVSRTKLYCFIHKLNWTSYGYCYRWAWPNIGAFEIWDLKLVWDLAEVVISGNLRQFHPIVHFSIIGYPIEQNISNILSSLFPRPYGLMWSHRIYYTR